MEIKRDDVINIENLFRSLDKCRKGVSWKPQAAHMVHMQMEQVPKLLRALNTGKYKPGKLKRIQITHPKPREAISIPFRDRVYQRTLNDLVVYPCIVPHLIYDNAACQKGKGTDFARNRLKTFLREYYRKHGTEGYVLQMDIKGYYPNLRHEYVNSIFKRFLPDWAYRECVKILEGQYAGDVGYNPGSQMVQIAGIVGLNDCDHYIKEQLRIRWYLRYMDDMVMIHHDKEFLECCLSDLKEYLERDGFMLHPEKTRIYSLSEGIELLGFRFMLSPSGRALMELKPSNVKNERKKLRRLVRLCKEEELTRKKVDDCYASWKAHASKGNNHELIRRMDKYYLNLWREDQ